MKKKLLSLAVALTMILGFIVPPQEAQAAGVGTSWGMSGGTQYFNITNSSGEEVVCEVFYVGGGAYASQNLAAGGSTSITADKNAYLELIVTGVESGAEYAYELSQGEHSYQVVYNMEGNAGLNEVIEEGYLQQGDSFSFTADSFWVAKDGSEWEFDWDNNPGDSTAIAFGTDSYVFNYKPYNPAAVSGTVTFVDEYGNVLQRKTQTINYEKGNGSATFTIDDELTVNGRKYINDDTVKGSLTIRYNDEVLDYEIQYRAQEQKEEGPYTVTVEYRELDASGKPGAFLGNAYFTQDTNATEDYVFNAPQTIRVRNQESGTETYYQVVSNAQIIQKPDGDERLYTAGYQKFDEKSPYDWSVRLIDAESGAILKDEAQTVEVDGTAVYQVKTEITADGKKYLLDSNMEREYTHAYNQGSRIQNIYYHEESNELPGAYDLTVQYMSVSDNTMLYAAKAEATAEKGGAEIASPANYTANGTEYVRLSGQTDTVNHDFYSPQRTYTIYYRDVNDLQNVDTVVTQEDVVTSENLVDEGTQTATVLANPATGTTVTLNDEGVPLANAPAGAENDDNLTTAEDEEVPLAKGIGNKDGKDKGILATAQNNPLAAGLILAAVMAALGCIGFFFWKKKNGKEAVAETTENTDQP